jgi:nucleoid-associated protein YgaU
MKRTITFILICCLLVPVLVYAQEKLTEKEAQEMLVTLQAQLAEAEAKLTAIEAEYEALKADVEALQSRRDGLVEKLAGLKETWKICQYGRYSVIEGDWLSKIASMRKTYHNGSRWPMIYEANKDKIKNPNLIYPGWVLLIPTLDQYEVAPGDAMWLIASYLSIYSNAKRWPEIYEANKDKIKDPDLIYPRQVFTVPH